MVAGIGLASEKFTCIQKEYFCILIAVAVTMEREAAWCPVVVCICMWGDVLRIPNLGWMPFFKGKATKYLCSNRCNFLF